MSNYILLAATWCHLHGKISHTTSLCPDKIVHSSPSQCSLHEKNLSNLWKLWKIMHHFACQPQINITRLIDRLGCTDIIWKTPVDWLELVTKLRIEVNLSSNIPKKSPLVQASTWNFFLFLFCSSLWPSQEVRFSTRKSTVKDLSAVSFYENFKPASKSYM